MVTGVTCDAECDTLQFQYLARLNAIEWSCAHGYWPNGPYMTTALELGTFPYSISAYAAARHTPRVVPLFARYTRRFVIDPSAPPMRPAARQRGQTGW